MRLRATKYIEMTLIRLYHYQELANSLSPIRNLKSEIPNIFGSIWGQGDRTGFQEAYDAFWKIGDTRGGGGPGVYDKSCTRGVGLDAFRCSDRYGSYTEVRPLYESCKYIICY